MNKKSNFEAKKTFELSSELVKLGLSEQEAQVYLTLVQNGALSAKEIGKTINVFPHTIYRTAKKLEIKKLITLLKTSPITYQALSPQLALSLFIKDKSLMMEKMAEEIYTKLSQKQSNSFPTKIDLIIGKSELFRQSTKMINKTKKELLIISIGEPIPEDCFLAIKNAYLREVKVKIIAHKYDKENKEVLENFKKNGYEIKHYSDSGFHMVIYDADKALLSVNNPQNTDERVSMQIFSHGLAKALRDYFYSVWNKAVPI